MLGKIEGGMEGLIWGVLGGVRRLVKGQMRRRFLELTIFFPCLPCFPSVLSR